MSYPPFCFHRADGYFWFRIFGYGLHFKNVQKHPMIFSERQGMTSYVKIGSTIIKFVKP